MQDLNFTSGMKHLSDATRRAFGPVVKFPSGNSNLVELPSTSSEPGGTLHRSKPTLAGDIIRQTGDVWETHAAAIEALEREARHLRGCMFQDLRW
jgi:hypothetical protein